jgi:hypothetical protein
MNLTDKEYMLLSQLAYQNIDEINADKYFKNMILKDMAQKIIKIDYPKYLANPKETKFDYILPGNAGMTTDQIFDVLEEIAADKNDNFSKLRLAAVENNNEGKDPQNDKGFKAMAFTEDGSNDTYFAFTGSEGASGKGMRDEDWINDFSMFINQDLGQLKEAEAFVNNNKVEGGTIYVTGHSLGGANAMYAAANIDGVTGVVFDAPGVGQFLTEEQKSRIKELRNSVGANDPLGSVGEHSEAQFFAKQLDYFIVWDEKNKASISNKSGELSQNGIFAGHFPQAQTFDDDGKIIVGEQGEMSKFFEWTYLNLTKDMLAGDTVVEDILNVFIKIENENNGETYNYKPTDLCELYDSLIKEGFGGLKKATGAIALDVVNGIKNNISQFKADIGKTIDNCTSGLKSELAECKNSVENVKSSINKYLENISTSVSTCEKYASTISASVNSIESGMLKVFAGMAISKIPNKQTISGINDISMGFSKANEVNLGKAAIEMINIFKETISVSKNIVTEELKTFKNVLDVSSILNNTFDHIVNEPKKLIFKSFKDLAVNLNERRENLFKSIIGFATFNANGFEYLSSDKMGQFTSFIKKVLPKFFKSRSDYITSVDMCQLNNISMKMKSLETSFGDTVTNVLIDVRKLADDINLNYKEYEVQKNLQPIYQLIQQLERENSFLCGNLRSMGQGVKNAIENYQTTEQGIIGTIKAANRLIVNSMPIM